MTSNEIIRDDLVEYEVLSILYAKGLSKSIVDILRTTDATIELRLRKLLSSDVKGVFDSKQWKRLLLFFDNLSKERKKVWKKAEKTFLKELALLSVLSVEEFDRIVRKALPVVITRSVPTKDLLESIVSNRLVQGRTALEWVGRLSENDIARMRASIQSGIASGLSTDQIINSIFGTNYAGGQIESVVKTVVSGVVNQSRQEYLKENSDIFGKEQFVAVLDSRTTILCASLDGKIYDAGEGPVPPLHMNCRSTRVPYFDGSALSDRPANTAVEKELLSDFCENNGLRHVSSREKLPHSYKKRYDAYRKKEIASRIGTVPARTTYSEWLRKRSVAFQNEVLGKTRAELFRKGKIDLARFVDSFGNVITLDKLSIR